MSAKYDGHQAKAAKAVDAKAAAKEGQPPFDQSQLAAKGAGSDEGHAGNHAPQPTNGNFVLQFGRTFAPQDLLPWRMLLLNFSYSRGVVI